MSSPEAKVIEKMFAAFSAKDAAQAVRAVSDGSLWIHHGTGKQPPMRFIRKKVCRSFWRPTSKGALLREPDTSSKANG